MMRFYASLLGLAAAGLGLVVLLSHAQPVSPPPVAMATATPDPSLLTLDHDGLLDMTYKVPAGSVVRTWGPLRAGIGNVTTVHVNRGAACDAADHEYTYAVRPQVVPCARDGMYGELLLQF